MGSSLEQKIAVVTGAGRGIGRAEALLLAAEGATVIVNDVDADQAKSVVGEIEGAGGTAVVSVEDVSSWDGAAAIVDQAVSSFGQLDVLVNNAGILRDAMSFSMDEAQWDDVIRVHLKGHAAAAHFAGLRWRERSKAGEEGVRGRIINTASESGLYGLAGQVNYAAAKAGIASMTIVLGRELKKYGVTVNAIAPRARTRMTEAVLERIGPTDGFDEWEPGNIAPIVAWLAGDDAQDVTGQVMVVFANRVHLMKGWDLDNTIESAGRFTVEELVDRKAELFEGRRSGLPPAGFGS